MDINKLQFWDHLQIMLHHGHKQSPTGQLLRASIEALAIESGCSGDPLAFSPDKICYTTQNTWIKETITQLHKNNVTLKHDIKGLNSWYNDDTFIMDKAISIMKGTQLKLFNKVRMFLKVVTMTDVVNAAGNFIDKNCFNGDPTKESPLPSTWTYIWPTIQSISKNELDIWQANITWIFQISSSGQINRNIVKWNSDACKVSNWVLNSRNNLIYQKTHDNKWIEWRRAMTNRRITRNSLNTFVPGPAIEIESFETYIPISVSIISNQEILLRNRGMTAIQNRCNDYEKFRSLIFCSKTNNY